MRLLRSDRLRLFLIVWIVYSAHFSTNIVREHYPAFSLVEQGNFQVDAYVGFHADIFEHTDGHAYVCNNVLPAVITALPLLVFDPLLDALEAHSLAQLEASEGRVDSSLETPFPNSALLFELARERGLELRFGASAALTTALLMAPLGALLAVLVCNALLRRGVARGRALGLAFLFAFATPLFYRSSHLSHNVLLMAAAFGSFLCLWRAGSNAPVGRGRLAAAGLLAGLTFALDYAGAIPATFLGLYALLDARRQPGRESGARACIGALVPFGLGALPAVVFLLWSQWWQFGDVLRPAQFHMPFVNYTDEGLRGLTWPRLETFVKNLISPSWGLVFYAPILVFAFWPARAGAGLGDARGLILGRFERRWVASFTLAFLLFCAANQYAMMQFNTGFRYLMPLVPFLYLAASEHFARWRTRTLLWVAIPCVVHQWVLTMTRELRDTEQELRVLALERGVSQLELEGYWRALLTETNVPGSYARILAEGPQLPWLRVLAGSPTARDTPLAHPLAASGVLLAVAALCVAIWRLGGRACREASREAS